MILTSNGTPKQQAVLFPISATGNIMITYLYICIFQHHILFSPVKSRHKWPSSTQFQSKSVVSLKRLSSVSLGRFSTTIPLDIKADWSQSCSERRRLKDSICPSPTAENTA